MHRTSKCTAHRSFIGGARTAGILCFYSAARPLAGLQGPSYLQVKGPPSQGRIGPPNF